MPLYKRSMNLRICMNRDCGKHLYRSNRFRLWRFVTEQEMPGLSVRARYQKCEVVLCTECFNNRSLGKMINLAGGPEHLPTRVIKVIGFK